MTPPDISGPDAATGVGSDVKVINVPTSDLVDSSLKNAAPAVGTTNGSAYTASTKSTINSSTAADEALYFPFKDDGVGAHTAVKLEIYDASNNAVWIETGNLTSASGAGHFFVINYKDSGKAHANATTHTSMSAGTYKYYITETTGNTLLVSGSFTLT